MPKILLSLLFLMMSHATAAQTAGNATDPVWEDWSDALMERARQENKFVLLDLEAIWCHWCHVMAATTYHDPAVVKLLKSNYITVRVDQDSRPDLSNRYEDYGWPATIVFGPDGKEIIKRSGYIAPENMASLLQAIIDDPSPGPSVRPEPELEFPGSPFLSEQASAAVHKNYLEGYDSEQGGWGTSHKFLDWDAVEYALAKAKTGDKQAESMARQTLKAQMKLLDPAWGGVYQYSTGGKWDEPHFEKIMSMQAENMRIYALAYSQWKNPEYLRMASEIHRFLQTFLTSPDGAFYTSQNADHIPGQHAGEYFSLSDRERRKLGVPRIDKHIYARENGWVIQALAALYSATGEAHYIEEARRAAQWIMANRALPKGGFRHDATDAAGPYLGDTLAMGRALLSLYIASGERSWLTHARQAADFIAANFTDKTPGYLTSKTTTDSAYTPRPQRDENIGLTRFANLLFHHTGNAEYRTMAEHAMRYLAAPQIAERPPGGGILLAHLELSSDPVHITIVGHKDDTQALALYQAAIRYPSAYKRVDWWDKREGPLPNPDVQYPELKTAAAFACSNQRCSQPVFKPEEVQARVDQLNKKPASNRLSGL